MDFIKKGRQVPGERPAGCKSSCKDTKRKRIVRYLRVYKWETFTDVSIGRGGQR